MNNEMPLPPCTSFCQNSDNSNGICRACMEREKSQNGILLNIAKRMTADSCIAYPQWLFTLVEEAIKIGNTRADKSATVERIEGLGEAIAFFGEHYTIRTMSKDEAGHRSKIWKAANAYLKLQGGE